MRTCTVMTYTDGRRAIYTVLRGRMKTPHIFDAMGAESIGQYKLKSHWPDGDSIQPDYKAMTAAFATEDAPAVYWQAADAPS